MTLLKDFFIGCAIFLVPAASFLKPYNWRQLSNFDIYLILQSLIVFLLILIISSIVFHFAITKIFKTRPHSLFPLLCFGFYLLFLFAPFHLLVANTILQNGFTTYFTITCLFFIWLSICIVVLHFKKFAIVFRRSLLIFASINIIYSLVLNAGYLIKNESTTFSVEKNVEQNLLNSKEINFSNLTNKSNDQNIYYIILDAMISLELAAKMNIINEIEVRNALYQAGLTYIDKSYSSYNVTYLSIASIMEVDHVITEQSVKYTDTKRFFPAMMYQVKRKIPLPELINKIGSKFIWVGTKSFSCLDWDTQPWTCTYSNTVGNIKHLVYNFYVTTPFKKLVSHLLSEDGNRNVKYYMNYSLQNMKNNTPKFVFIHQNSPHDPYLVNENCQPHFPYSDIYEGYKASYRCVLQEVLDFMTYISINDPKAIVVFQADHGWIIPEKLNTQEDKILHRAKIFNAIKAPIACFQKFGKPHSNVNTIRFILNCAYGFDLPYREVVHHQAFFEDNSRYGSIKSHKF